MSTINKRLGANIRRIRQEKNLMQKEFSKKVGLDAAYLSNIENGKMNPTVTTIEKIAKALGVTVSELTK
ncbi:MAG: helix-turn-helix transcriptional regulator [Candidatus Vogelbacteria bacterium]|nr:helix-turn-helix transcriptional regulator [Candidatus Vogelbacteria bacterium]